MNAVNAISALRPTANASAAEREVCPSFFKSFSGLQAKAQAKQTGSP